MSEETTETVETTESPTFASFIQEDGALKEGWKETLPEDLRGEKCLDLIGDTNSLFKNYIHAQKSFGKDKVVVPSETSPPEDVDAFLKAWGRPETIDDYTFNRAEDIPEEAWDTDRIAKFKEGAYNAGFNGKQMAFVEEFYNSLIKEDLASVGAAEQKAVEEADKALKEKWGDAYNERLHLANRVINDTTEEGPAREALLSKIGNDPIVTEWMAEMGMKLVESKTIDTKVHVSTPNEILAEIADIEGMPGFMGGTMKQNNPTGYAAACDKRKRLYEEAYKE